MTHDNDLDLIREGVAAARGDTTPSAADAQRSLDRLHARLGQQEPVDIRGRGRQDHRWLPQSWFSRLDARSSRQWLWSGATTAFIVMLIFAVHRTPNTEVSLTRVYSTTMHQRAVINLDDGTRVTLSPQTTLKLQRFGPTSRLVLLDKGEAYFEVAKTAGAPFIVQSGAATARVLGTSFLVRHEAGDSHVRVSVADGKVRVTTSRTNAGVTLSAGQVGDVKDSITQVNNSDGLTPGTEWAPGRIMFRHVSAEIILKTVSQWYGYHFRYTDQDFGKQNVTMIVSTRSSAEALAAIEQVFAVNLTVTGDTITLVPQPPRSSRNAPRIRTYDVWTPTREVGR